MKDERYNGHANYETWAACLWLDNDEGSYRFWRNEARRIWSKHAGDEDGHHSAITQLAEQLKDDVTEAAPLIVTSLYSDLLTAALSEVDWWEIATGMIDEVRESEQLLPNGDEEEELEAR